MGLFILHLGMMVITGKLTLERALEFVSSQDFLKRLDDRTIANSYNFVNQIFEQQPQIAAILARLNYTAAQLRANDRLQSYCAFSLADVYNRLGRFQEALELYERARDVFEEKQMPVEVATCNINMANVCNELNQFDQALELYRRARDVFEENQIPV